VRVAEQIILVRVQGHVQGVGFRAFVQREAERLGVRGWVRNRLNGDVEALFGGSTEAIDALCEACRRGPSHARIMAVDLEAADPALEKTLPASGFEILPTT
jgi:acylphosphatase